MLIPTANAEDAASNRVAIPENLSLNEVGEFIAPLGEEQVRTLLIDSLRADALDDQVVDGQTQRSMLDLPKEIGNPDSQLGGAIVELKNSTNTYVSSVGSIVKK